MVESPDIEQNGETSFLGKLKGHHNPGAGTASGAKPWHHGAALQSLRAMFPGATGKEGAACYLHPILMASLHTTFTDSMQTSKAVFTGTVFAIQ